MIDAARLALATELLPHDWESNFATAYKSFEKSGITIPKSYDGAVNDPIYGQQWRDAIHQEVQTLIQFDTWRLVPRRSVQKEGKKIINTSWVFDIKIGADRKIDRFKARLVARGDRQHQNDIEQTYAPVIRMDSFRILIAIAARYDLTIHLMDATNAFVKSEIDTPNYIEIFKGLENFEDEAGDSSMVLELRKSLYGLRQSANSWHKKISMGLMRFGFRSSSADSSVFLNSRGLIIAIYVDDLLIIGKPNTEVESVKAKIKSLHPMKDCGIADKVLGIRISLDSNYIMIDQQIYVEQILAEFGMSSSKSQSIPLSPSVDPEELDSPKLRTQDHRLYRRIIGRLMYLAIGTRPDITYATSRLSQYLSDSKLVHLQAHIIRYLRGTTSFSIAYKRGVNVTSYSAGGLAGFADSGYANSTGKKSTSGNGFMLN